jgi:hypothetical protein
MLFAVMNWQAANGFTLDAVILINTDVSFVSLGQGSKYTSLNFRPHHTASETTITPAVAVSNLCKPRGIRGTVSRPRL